MTDFASIYETNVFTIKQDHLSTNSIHVSTCQWRRKQVESEWGICKKVVHVSVQLLQGFREQKKPGKGGE